MRGACPDENTLVQLVDGTLPTDARADHARHLDECDSCRRAVGSLVRLLSPEEHPALARTVASEHPPAQGGAGPSQGTDRQGFVAGDVVGRYQLERIIGEGGLGVVWAARHVLTRKPVALKFTKFEHPELTKRFLREARVGGVLQHPAVVEVHDVFESKPGGPLVMVMDLLHGESLDGLIARRGRLSLHEVSFVMQPVLSALAAAHALGIVHRDIKPPNIFLESPGGGSTSYRSRLLDFGLARLTAAEGVAAATSVLTREKQLMGTPHYMAPEQLYGELDIDARTDVWAIGVVFYECLTGKRPLVGNSVGQILQSLATREIAPVASVVPDLPADLAQAIDASLARDRAARTPSILPLLALTERGLGMTPSM
jgi:serine/threonine-protein kinase